MALTSVDFDKDGFAIFKNVLTLDEIQILRDETAKLINRPIDPRQGDSRNVKANILMRSDVIAKLFLQDKVMKVVKEVCGENFYILPEISVMKSQYGRWHKDTTSIELFGQNFHKKADFRVVNVAIYCQNNSEFGGGLDVVPGSHKFEDSFVEYYREQQKNPIMAPIAAIKSNFAQKSYAGFKTGVKNFLLKTSLLPKKYEIRMKNEGVAYELDATDTRENKYRIPSEAGDIVIFDLRMDHKASWPMKEFDLGSIPVKYAFFAICGANNEATREYRKYLNKRAETQESYKYLENYMVSPALQKFGIEQNITIL